MLKIQHPKIVSKLVEKPEYLSRMDRLSRNYLAFLEAKKFLGNICSFEQLFYRKMALGAPDIFLFQFSPITVAGLVIEPTNSGKARVLFFCKAVEEERRLWSLDIKPEC